MANQFDIAPIRVFDKHIAAQDYNQVRLAIRRLGTPIQFELTKHRGLEVILYDTAWHCMDFTQFHQPILVWQDFASKGRDDLQQPVYCKLYIYHLH